eukprot:6731147-Pyramimonas_sp.AAC.1
MAVSLSRERVRYWRREIFSIVLCRIDIRDEAGGAPVCDCPNLPRVFSALDVTTPSPHGPSARRLHLSK